MSDFLQNLLGQARQSALNAPLYSIEPHGEGFALYLGRAAMQHGYNLAHITEASPSTRQLIVDALNTRGRPSAVAPAGSPAPGESVSEEMIDACLAAITEAFGSTPGHTLTRETWRAALEAALKVRDTASVNRAPKVAAWCWVQEGHPESNVSSAAVGGFLAFEGEGPDSDIEDLAAKAAIPRKVRRFVELGPRK